MNDGWWLQDFMCLDNAWATKAAIHDAAGIKDPWNASDVSVRSWAQGRPCQMPNWTSYIFVILILYNWCMSSYNMPIISPTEAIYWGATEFYRVWQGFFGCLVERLAKDLDSPRVASGNLGPGGNLGFGRSEVQNVTRCSRYLMVF